MIGIDLHVYMMLMHESHAFELRIEMKLEVCDPRTFSNTINARISAQLPISAPL